MGAVRSLCSSCMCVDQGRLVDQGDVDEVVARYLRGKTQRNSEATSIRVGSAFEFLGMHFTSPDGAALLPLQPAQLRVTLRMHQEIDDVGVRIDILDEYGNLLMGIPSWLITRAGKAHVDEELEFAFQFQSLPISPGRIRVAIHLQDHGRFKSYEVPEAYEFSVGEQPPFVGRRGQRRRVGPVASDVSVAVSRGGRTNDASESVQALASFALNGHQQ